jgi:hypothetical protein
LIARIAADHIGELGIELGHEYLSVIGGDWEIWVLGVR